MSDQQRDEKRIQFQNLRAIIVDEVSMVSADMLYNLDMKLREIKQCNKPMGNVACFFFGDMFQLRPVLARFIFEEPTDEDNKRCFHADNIWKKFEIITLEENHRQGEDKSYADLLNRVRKMKHTYDDIKILEERVVMEDSPELEQHDDSLYIYGCNEKVNKRNNDKLKKTEGEMYTILAKNEHKTIKNFKPPTDKTGSVKHTNFQSVLELKKGAEVMLIWNVNTCDGLTNGSRGQLLDVELTKEGVVKRLIIQFYVHNHGWQKRQKDPCHKYPEGTYIEPILFQYQLGSSTATIYQFPIRLAFAITAHKIQGQTICKPQKLVTDIQSAFIAGMVYVMLSRVCALSQLFIIIHKSVTRKLTRKENNGSMTKIDWSKIQANQSVLTEVERMEKVSINKNPNSWNNPKVTGMRLSSLNIRSLKKHIQDIQQDDILTKSDIICLQETWLENEDKNGYGVNGYELHLNSQGRGKGLAIYFKKDIFKHETDVKKPNLQMSKMSTEQVDVIVVYRSQNENFKSVKNHIETMINFNKTTIIVGDLNYCHKSDKNELSEYFKEKLFEQQVKNATHIQGGVLDQVQFRSTKNQSKIIVDLCPTYYTYDDHDIVTVLLQE